MQGRNVLIGVVAGLAVLLALIWGLQRLTVAQMSSFLPERPVQPGEQPFALAGSLSPEVPVAGKPVEITAQISSQTSPHTTVIIRFFVDDQEVYQTSGIIPPFQTANASYQWEASAGVHRLRIEIGSRAGVVYDTWEREVTAESR